MIDLVKKKKKTKRKVRRIAHNDTNKVKSENIVSKILLVFTTIFGATLGPFIGLAIFVGDIYFIYLGFKLGSFAMIFLGFTPLAVITGPVGAYSLFFGPPAWLLNMFG